MHSELSLGRRASQVAELQVVGRQGRESVEHHRAAFAERDRPVFGDRPW